MTKLRWTKLLTIFLAFSVLAAACGSSDDENTTAEAPTTDAPTTEAPTTEAPTTEAPTTEPPAMEELEAPEVLLGTLLPETGPLAVLGAGMIPAAQMAVDSMNAAGANITLVTGDSATDPDIANATVDAHLAAGVQGIIGAASSGTSSSVIDKITGAQVAQCSPSNTAAGLGTTGDDGYYFRTAASDDLQAPTLADLILTDGFANVAMITRADEYGVGFIDFFIPAFEDGGGSVVYSDTYAPEAESFDDVVGDVVASGPDAVVIIAFEEGFQIIIDMIAAGIGPADIPIYITDGFSTEIFGEKIDPSNPGVAEGIKGTGPSAAPDNGAAFFPEAFRAAAGEDTPAIFAAHSYDCAIIFGLAALAAGSGDAVDWVPLVVDVTREGTACTSYEECAELLSAGEDIDYNGAAGPLDFLDVGEPGAATYDIYVFDSEGKQEVIDQIAVG